MCVGICVLLAIVYVLSRTGGNDMILAGSTTNSTSPVPVQQQQQQQHIRTSTDIPTSSMTDTTTKTTTTATTTASKTPDAGCDCPSLGNENDILASLREKALKNSPPAIIECAEAKAGESQKACQMPSETRFAAVGQKGATLWFTGCSASGKTTIAKKLEERLVRQHGKHVYRVDGDNLRIGLNRDLTFTASDRAESVRRAGEVAALFSDAGVITLVGLISPYIADRDLVRERHEAMNIPFYEVFLDVPRDELEKRDPKGQYERYKNGEIKNLTCVDDPYEDPPHPEFILKTHELEIEESVEILFRQLERDGILIGAPKVTPP